MQRQHAKAVHRKRRIIFNNDGDDALYYAKEPTPQGLLEVRAIPATNTHVDSMFYCTVLPFGSFQHNTQVGEVFTQDVAGKRNITKHLIAQGTDPLKVMADYCQTNGIEIFSSFRMNDVHDGAGFPMFLPEFKQQHPEFLFGSEESPPRYGYWSGVDYGQPEIRDLAFTFISDICRRYDIDGIELDFYRASPFFKRHAWGKSVLKRELEEMTSLLRRVRQMTAAVEEQRTRPFLVAARILESVELSRDYGLDLLAWLKEGLIDLIITGEVSLAPWEDLIHLGHQYGVPVYPCLRRTMWYDDPDYKSVESFRAQALSAWKLGADGIYLFNLFPEEGYTDLFSELGEPELLEARDKLYSLDPVRIEVFSKYFGRMDRYITRSVISPKNPLGLRPGVTRRIPMFVGDALREDAKSPAVSARISLTGQEGASGLSVALNGHELAFTQSSLSQLEADVPPRWLRCGYNLFEFRCSGSGSLTVLDLKLTVRY